MSLLTSEQSELLGRAVQRIQAGYYKTWPAELPVLPEGFKYSEHPDDEVIPGITTILTQQEIVEALRSPNGVRRTAERLGVSRHVIHRVRRLVKEANGR